MPTMARAASEGDRNSPNVDAVDSEHMRASTTDLGSAVQRAPSVDSDTRAIVGWCPLRLPQATAVRKLQPAPRRRCGRAGREEARADATVIRAAAWSVERGCPLRHEAPQPLPTSLFAALPWRPKERA